MRFVNPKAKYARVFDDICQHVYLSIYDIYFYLLIDITSVILLFNYKLLVFNFLCLLTVFYCSILYIYAKLFKCFVWISHVIVYIKSSVIVYKVKIVQLYYYYIFLLSFIFSKCITPKAKDTFQSLV